MINPTRIASNPIAIIAQPVLLLAMALVPWPIEWERANDVIESIRSPERNRAAAGYYEIILGGPDARDAVHDNSSMRRLIGKPEGSDRFQDSDVVHYLKDDFLQFELEPSIERTFFGQPFVTNAYGMHDDPVTREKPKGTFRVAVLGASIDMGWGVKQQDTYINRLEEWLTAHSERLHISPPRRFEVLNFGVAAYSPLQRLEVLRRKVKDFDPDMVIYSATTLDKRLLEIHVCDMLWRGVDLEYDFLRRLVANAGVTENELRKNRDGRMVNKDRLKQKLYPHIWKLYDDTMAAVAAECRAAGLPVVVVIIPRVGQSNALASRAEDVARLRAIATHHALTVYDLSDTFDRFDPATLEVAPWDDHPNASGHNRLFLALARAIVEDHPLYRWLFPHDGVAEVPSPDAGADSVRTSGIPDPEGVIDMLARPAG
jgi:hypothetical protein